MPADLNRRFLGRNDGNSTLGNSNDILKLSLNGLGAHTKLAVSFDVYVINSWDGNGDLGNFGFGPDIFGVSLKNMTPGSASGLLTTFSNVDHGEAGSDPVVGALQSYPNAFPDLPGAPAQSGANEVGTLGYNDFGATVPRDDSVYHISLTFDHTATSMDLSFFALGLQDITDESWGLDNVRVDATAPVPVPAPLMLLGSGVLGLTSLRRRR